MRHVEDLERIGGARRGFREPTREVIVRDQHPVRVDTQRANFAVKVVAAEGEDTVGVMSRPYASWHGSNKAVAS